MSVGDPTSVEYWRRSLAKHFEQNAVRGSITLVKLKFFEKRRGDDDRLDPSVRDKVLSHDEWRVIAKLVDDAFLVSKGLASAAYSEQHKEQLTFACDSVATATDIARVAIEIHKPTLIERFVRWTTGKK